MNRPMSEPLLDFFSGLVIGIALGAIFAAIFIRG